MQGRTILLKSEIDGTACAPKAGRQVLAFWHLTLFCCARNACNHRFLEVLDRLCQCSSRRRDYKLNITVRDTEAAPSSSFPSSSNASSCVPRAHPGQQKNKTRGAKHLGVCRSRTEVVKILVLFLGRPAWFFAILHSSTHLPSPFLSILHPHSFHATIKQQ